MLRDDVAFSPIQMGGKKVMMREDGYSPISLQSGIFPVFYSYVQAHCLLNMDFVI